MRYYDKRAVPDVSGTVPSNFGTNGLHDQNNDSPQTSPLQASLKLPRVAFVLASQS